MGLFLKFLLCAKIKHRVDLGGNPLVPMVQQLLPDGHLNFRDVQVHQLPLVPCLSGDEVWQEGDTGAFLHHAANQVGVADFQNRNDFQGTLCQLLIQEAPIAHAFFGEDEGLLYQIRKGNLFPGGPGERRRTPQNGFPPAPP